MYNAAAWKRFLHAIDIKHLTRHNSSVAWRCNLICKHKKSKLDTGLQEGDNIDAQIEYSTAQELEDTLNKFNEAWRSEELEEEERRREKNEPEIGRLELFLGDPKRGFRLDHEALNINFVPVAPQAPVVGLLGTFKDKDFDSSECVTDALV